MAKFITLHYNGHPVCYNVDNIITASEGRNEEAKGYTVIECVNDTDGDAHLVDEAPDVVKAKAEGGAE